MALNNLGDVTDSGTLLVNTTAIVNAATTASTSVVITTVNANLFVGQTVTGPGVQQANGIVGPTTITALSTDGLTLTLSNPATFVAGAVLTFSSVYSAVTTTTVNGAISSSTTAVTIVANTLIAAGQLVSAAGVTGVNTVSSVATTSLVLSAPVTTVADKAVLTFWAPVTPNVAVDFVWKNLPVQPNDDRNTTAVNQGGAGVQSVYISGASKPSTGTIQYTTNAAHGLSVGDIVSTGSYATAGTPGVTVTLTSVANTAGTVNFSYGNSNLTSATGSPQVGAVLNKTAGTGVFASGANVITSVDTTAKTFTVAAVPTTDFSGATLVTGGFPVTTSTATFSSAAKDATLLTQEITASGTHYIAPGTTVVVSAATPAAYSTSPNGAYVVLGASSKTKFTIGTLTTTLTTNNIGSKDATTASSAVLSAATLTYYPLDVKELKVIAVPSTTTFVVASTNGWSGDSTDTGIAAVSSKTGSLALVADASWADTTKAGSSRLNNGSINSTRNYLNYVTPTYDTYASGTYNNFPNFIPGKFAVSTVTATTNYIVYSAVNNLTTSNTLNVSGISNPAFNQVGATIVAVKNDTIVTSNPSTSINTASASTASNQITLASASGAIKVGMTVSGTGIAGTPKVVAVLGTLITMDSAQTVGSGVSMTFKVAAGTTLTKESGVASPANFGVGSYNVTAVSGDGTTITYTSQNNLVKGDVVVISGLSNSNFNFNSGTSTTSVTVATANATSFTVTNSAGSGVSLTGQVGKVEYANAASNVDGGFVSGTYYPQVPNLVGLTATQASDAFLDRGLTALAASGSNTGAVPTTSPKGSGATSSAFARIVGSNVLEVTAVEAITGVVATGSANSVTRASGTAVTNVKVGQTIASTTITPARNILTVDYGTGAITFDGAAVGTVTTETLTITGHGFVTGDAVVVSGGDATVNGDQTVIVKDTSTLLINTGSTVAYSGTTALTITGKAGYVHAQSVAAGTQSQAPSTAVTYSVWG
jgi:hypothetical protein